MLDLGTPRTERVRPISAHESGPVVCMTYLTTASNPQTLVNSGEDAVLASQAGKVGLGSVGPASSRIGGANFNGLFVFDFFGFPSLAAAYAATSKPGVPVSVTVTYPSSLPIFCSGQTIDSPIQ